MRSLRPRRRAGTLAAVVCATVLAACGDEAGGSAQDATADEPASSSSPAAPAREPACDEVWIDGATLPRPYAGCSTADGAWVAADRMPCSFGGAIVTYDGRFYAVVGNRVNDVGDLAASDQFQSALSNCQA